ncbi:unnamed protein product [Phytophthora fragariaefolia]|uniref:Unnamed protein product n=1 Tax=Phytophthora fragariaefolia TaxID=1490495 RepID=A0A9W6Y2Y4_9STRA|nr:unnamed protein product [Phytophthora fragariaefolia]
MASRCRRLAYALPLLAWPWAAAQSRVASEATCSAAPEALNASATSTWTLLDGAASFTRVAHCSEALADRVLILGGVEFESTQPVVRSPVLVYHVASNAFLQPQDQIRSAVSAAFQAAARETVFVSPASRAEHASFVHQDGAVFLFGGRSRELANDTWRGCVDASSANVVWDELVTGSDPATAAAAPAPRVGHSFTKVFENGSVIGALVFGGVSEDAAERSGLHLAVIAKAASSAPACTDRSPKLLWRMLNAGPLTASGPVPTARAYHAAMAPTKHFTPTKLACVVVHGGKSSLEGTIFNELWRLCPPSVLPSSVPVERMNYTWELLPEIGTTPGARYGASITFVDEGKLALAGGSYTFPSDFLSDTWELNVNATQWIRLSFTADYTPPRRGHTLTFFSPTTRLFLFGGRDRYAVVQKRMQAAYYAAPFCAAGLKITFCSATSKYVCIACPAGSYLESGSRNCLACPQGTSSSAGSAECTKCPAGTYSTDVGKDSSSPCTSCPSGTFSQSVGAVSSAACNACAAGTFSSSPGSVSCSSCAAGTFSNANASTCSACPRGKWSAAGADVCTNCAAGTYTPNTGSTACYSCPRGFFSNQGDATCSACPVNTYSSSVGASASACQACPSYAFTTSAGQIECDYCPSGSTWTGVTCQLCSKGYYASTDTNGACTACPKGSYAPDIGSSACQSCPDGKFTSTTGSTNSSDCQLCTGGSFLNGAVCQTCGAGTYPEPSGFCTSCVPGSYSSGGGISEVQDTSLGCVSCPSMSYSSGTGATSCSNCADNTYSMEAWRNCVSCSASQASLPGCVTGRNGLLCSGNGKCVYGGCACNSNWVGGDCSVPVNDAATPGGPAVLFFPSAPLQLVNASKQTADNDVVVEVTRSGYLNSRLQATISWSSSNFTTSPLSFPTSLDFAPGDVRKTIKIPIAQLSPRNGCRFFSLILQDVSGASISAVSSDPDSKLTVYVDDMNGVLGGVTGKPVTSIYVRQNTGSALATVTLDRLVTTQLTLTPQTTNTGTNFGVLLRDQPLNLLVAIDFSATWVSSFINLLPATIAHLQTVYRTVPDGVRLGLLSGTTKPSAVFYPDLVSFLDGVQTLAGYNTSVDWTWISNGLAANAAAWPAADRRHLLIVAGKSLIAGGSISLPSALIDQLRSQSVFTFTLTPTQVTLTSGVDVMKSVGFGTKQAIPSVLRQAFEQKDSVLPSNVNILSDPAALVSSIQVTGFSSGSSSLSVVLVTLGSFPTPAQVQAISSMSIVIAVPGGSMISIQVSEPGRACFPPVSIIAVDSLPLSGWADAWHLSTLGDITHLWKSSSTPSMTLRQTTSLLRKSTNTALSISDSASRSLRLERDFSGSFFAAGLLLASRGYWRTASDNGTAVCNIQLTIVGTNKSLTSSSVVPFTSDVVPGEWNYGYLKTIIPWKLSSLTVILACNTSSAGVLIEWAALGLLPDPDFACMCPRGFYYDTLSDEEGSGTCVRCAAGSFCAAGIKRQCPSGSFSFGKAASCETCREGWICTDGLARLCDPGTYSTPSVTCDACPSGYACQNGKKSICPAGMFSLPLASECQSCPPGTISRSEG